MLQISLPSPIFWKMWCEQPGSQVSPAGKAQGGCKQHLSQLPRSWWAPGPQPLNKTTNPAVPLSESLGTPAATLLMCLPGRCLFFVAQIWQGNNSGHLYWR